MDAASKQSSYQNSSLLSGKGSTPKGETPFLQESEGFTLNPVLSDMQEDINNLNLNGFSSADLFYQLPLSQFEAARLELENLQAKAVDLATGLGMMEDQASEDEHLLRQVGQVRELLEGKVLRLVNMKVRMDHVSKQREDGEKRRLEEQNLSSGQIEESAEEKGTDDMTNQHSQIHSDALPPMETVTDETTGSSIPSPSVSFEGNSKFAEFSTHLAVLKSLFEENSARLGALGDDSLGEKGKIFVTVTKLLQNDFYDQAQTLSFQTSFEKIEEEGMLSYREALSALPPLIQFASSIQADTMINLANPNIYINTLKHLLNNLAKILNTDQAQ